MLLGVFFWFCLGVGLLGCFFFVVFVCLSVFFFLVFLGFLCLGYVVFFFGCGVAYWGC